MFVFFNKKYEEFLSNIPTSLESLISLGYREYHYKKTQLICLILLELAKRNNRAPTVRCCSPIIRNFYHMEGKC